MKPQRNAVEEMRNGKSPPSNTLYRLLIWPGVRVIDERSNPSPVDSSAAEQYE
jgi:hypothetical protein